MNLSARYAPGAAGVPPHFTAISVSAAAVALTLALLLKWKPFGRLEFLIPWLTMVAGIGITAAFLRGWVQHLTAMCRDAIPYLGVAIPVAIAVTLLFIVVYDLWPKHPTTKTTAIAAFALPAVAPEIGGAVGVTLASALSWVAVAGARIIATTFGV
jgi:hypothetical protein